MAALQAATQDTQRLEEELGRLREGMAEEQQSSKKILAELSELKAQTREVRPRSTVAHKMFGQPQNVLWLCWRTPRVCSLGHSSTPGDDTMRTAVARRWRMPPPQPRSRMTPTTKKLPVIGTATLVLRGKR